MLFFAKTTKVKIYILIAGIDSETLGWYHISQFQVNRPWSMFIHRIFRQFYKLGTFLPLQII